MNGFLCFIKGLFLDDSNEPCIARFSLFLGIVITTFTATVYMNTDGEVSWGEAVVRCCPAVIGLIAYVFTRLFEQREWISDLTKNIANARNKKVCD